MALAQVDSLIESLAAALESTAFISLMPSDPSALPPESAVVATIELVGAGCLHLAASPRLGALIAANILMLEPGSAEAHVRAADALKEILNVTAGAFSSGCDPVPEMGLPQISMLEDADAWQAWVKSMSAEVILAEEHLVAIAIEAKS